jgi:polysaccharide chain length determinant protein (PEP-CTERM system associated)
MDQLLEQLFEHLRGIWLRRFWGLAVAWLIAVTGLAYALVTPSRYEASARVFVDTQSVLKPLMQGLAVQPNIDQQVEILAGTLLSRPNVEKLIRLVDLDVEIKSEQQRNALIEGLIRAVQLKGSIRDNLFSLSYRDTDPMRAKRVVESLLSMFVESGLSNKRRDTGRALTFLDAQIAEYEVVLREAERRLKEFRLQNLEQLSTGSDAVGNMMALDGEIEKARTELRAAEQRREALRRQLAGEQPAFLSDPAMRAAGPSVGTDPLAEIDARADALRRNLDELLRKYTEEHPDVVGTRRILSELEKQREAMVEARRRAGPAASAMGTARLEHNPVYQQLKVTLADAEGDVAGLQARLSELESRYNRIRATARLKPEFEEELAQLNREYQIQKTNFEQLVQRREAAKLTGELDASASVDFRVIDPPRVSPNPVAPNRKRLIAAVLLLSLGAGMASSFMVSRTFPTVSTVKQLHAVAETAVLGSVSYWPSPAMLRRRKRNNYAFAGGVTGLFALFGVALTVLFFAARMG